MQEENRRLAISLFSGAGIGDVGLRAAGFTFIALCEKEEKRAALAALNLPDAQVYGDIHGCTEHLIASVQAVTSRSNSELSLITCTAPCQGMSKNGRGHLLNSYRRGKRAKLDPRNRLILPALDVIVALNPAWVVFENVLEMRNTVIETEPGQFDYLLDIINQRLQPTYSGTAYDVEFADYGIPQRRQRLITVYTRDPVGQDYFRRGVDLIPPCTHARHACPGRRQWVTVADAIEGFPPLDAGSDETRSCPTLAFHRVPLLEPVKYEWVKHTPVGKSAFDNQCTNPECGYQGNLLHGAKHNEDGINKANSDTPIHCARCGALLPRPTTTNDQGELRLMSGFVSAYKRMQPDLPAPTLTRNLSWACSDQKLHPFQHRALSLAEAMKLQTISEYDYRWGPVMTSTKQRRAKRMGDASDTLIREVIGESVPPRFFELLGRHIISLGHANAHVPRSRPQQLSLY